MELNTNEMNLMNEERGELCQLIAQKIKRFEDKFDIKVDRIELNRETNTSPISCDPYNLYVRIKVVI